MNILWLGNIIFLFLAIINKWLLFALRAIIKSLVFIAIGGVITEKILYFYIIYLAITFALYEYSTESSSEVVNYCPQRPIEFSGTCVMRS